jgi:hypothetical protein
VSENTLNSAYWVGTGITFYCVGWWHFQLVLDVSFQHCQSILGITWELTCNTVHSQSDPMEWDDTWTPWISHIKINISLIGGRFGGTGFLWWLDVSIQRIVIWVQFHDLLSSISWPLAHVSSVALVWFNKYCLQQKHSKCIYLSQDETPSQVEKELAYGWISDCVVKQYWI